MKVLVCGGRTYSNAGNVVTTLDMLNITTIITGDAPGADSLARRYGHANGIPCVMYSADWQKYGKAAGPLRNKKMLEDNPDIELVVAFAGGRGTADMVRQATKAGIPIRRVL